MRRRLIEGGFPLREASLDSVHEKNVRHGHISTLHIWPARRPLAACRAALLATLLPDPGTEEGRRKLRERIGGSLTKTEGKDGRMRDETVGGILHWGREETEGGREKLQAFREEIRAAFSGRAPRVLDPFAGGGAIPLEAMRLGCEVTASDLNPVAWFVLRCTLHYPRLVGRERRALPEFAVADPEFRAAMEKAGASRKGGPSLFASGDGRVDAEFAWHLRAWGRRVLAGARKRLAARYPTYAEFEPVRWKGRRRPSRADERFEPRAPRRLEPDADGRVSAEALNADFDELYLAEAGKPRWVEKPTVAYLWARTGACGNCRMEVPLLKTCWLSKKPGKRVLLTMEAREDGSGVEFGIERESPDRAGGPAAGAPAAWRERGGRLGAGTMSRNGARCPGCGAMATMGDLRAQGRAGRLGARLTAVVVDGQRGKEYRLPTDAELEAARVGAPELDALYAGIPFGLPDEPTPDEGALGMRIPRYGFDRWRKLFTDRQLLTLGVFTDEIRGLSGELSGYPAPWREALTAYLALGVSRVADRGSALATWTNDPEKIRSTFARFALPIVWDFAESCPLADTTGGFLQGIEWIARVVEHTQKAARTAPPPTVVRKSATDAAEKGFDVIATDPPYYDAIPYSDLMDFFHIWLRRVLRGLSPETDAAFADPLGPKWDRERGDGELVDDAARFGGDREASKQNYEDGMARAFTRFREALADDGRLVIVFANKAPDAWETLVSALVRSGFVVDASWPIRTEMTTRQRSLASAALSSSIWLVCRKRSATTAGWDSAVLADMEQNITERLRDFWDAGIRGPDLVWAATGPGLEAFSRYPAVRRERSPGETLSVSEFLRRVRRMVVGFVVRRVLRADGEERGDLDGLTTYYLLHRKDFRLEPAPAGAAILYALSCGLRDGDLAGRSDLLVRGGAAGGGDDEAPTTASGGEARLKPWNQRRSRTLGEPAADGAAPPLIDCLHRLMRLWKDGDRQRVDAYLEARGLWNNSLFNQVAQAVLELSDLGGEERSILESIQKHLAAHGGAAAPRYLGSI